MVLCYSSLSRPKATVASATSLLNHSLSAIEMLCLQGVSTDLLFKYLPPSLLTLYLVRYKLLSYHFVLFKPLINSILSQNLMLTRRATFPFDLLWFPIA